MTPAQALLLLTPAAYVVGSVPFGLVVGLAKGVDPRNAGSGNIGATNVGRLLGGKYFALVFTLDLLKGVLPSLAAGRVLHFHAADRREYALWLLVAFAAIFGHMFSLFLKFKGGKGVATSTGALLGLWPYFTLPTLVAAAVWGVTFKATRYVSAASILGSIAFPIAYVVLGLVMRWNVFGVQSPLLAAAVALAALIVYKHRANIARLRAGTENRAGKPAPAPARDNDQPAKMMNPE